MLAAVPDLAPPVMVKLALDACRLDADRRPSARKCHSVLRNALSVFSAASDRHRRGLHGSVSSRSPIDRNRVPQARNASLNRLTASAPGIRARRRTLGPSQEVGGIAEQVRRQINAHLRLDVESDASSASRRARSRPSSPSGSVYVFFWF